MTTFLLAGRESGGDRQKSRLLFVNGYSFETKQRFEIENLQS